MGILYHHKGGQTLPVNLELGVHLAEAICTGETFLGGEKTLKVVQEGAYGVQHIYRSQFS